MFVRSSRLRVTIAAFALVIVTGGCGADEPGPQPDPDPKYSGVPEDLCEKLPFEDVFQRHGLKVAPDYSQDSRFQSERTHWYGRCSFVAVALDGRFATKLGEFLPGGSVEVRVYHDVAGAVHAYNEDEYSYFDLREETVPGTTTSEITGWWGADGRSAEAIKSLDSSGSTTGFVPANRISVSHLVRHENLVMMVWESANVSTAETIEALALLHDLTRALIDETVTHLDGQ